MDSSPPTAFLEPAPNYSHSSTHEQLPIFRHPCAEAGRKSRQLRMGDEEAVAKPNMHILTEVSRHSTSIALVDWRAFAKEGLPHRESRQAQVEAANRTLLKQGQSQGQERISQGRTSLKRICAHDHQTYLEN